VTEVELVGDAGDAFTLRVRVKEGSSETSHEVTLARKDFDRLARKGERPEQLVGRCFDFLLEREPKESILRRFDVSVISRYFPEFEREITRAP
jgi:hypothetical protein